MSLSEARFEAQKIAFAPLVFQAARLLRELGILAALRGGSLRPHAGRDRRESRCIPLWRAGAARGRSRRRPGARGRRTLPADRHRRGHPERQPYPREHGFHAPWLLPGHVLPGGCDPEWQAGRTTGDLRRVGDDLPGSAGASPVRARELAALGSLLLRRGVHASPVDRPRALAAKAPRCGRQYQGVGDPMRTALAGCLGHASRPPDRSLRRRRTSRPSDCRPASARRPSTCSITRSPSPTASTPSG